MAVSWAHDGDISGVGSGRAVEEFRRGTLSMMIEGCRGMSGALFCLAQGRGREGQGNLKSWREGAGDDAWREGAGDDA